LEVQRETGCDFEFVDSAFRSPASGQFGGFDVYPKAVFLEGVFVDWGEFEGVSLRKSTAPIGR
jgi:hypothetical protein